jgi:HlyD family secretion protein
MRFAHKKAIWSIGLAGGLVVVVGALVLGATGSHGQAGSHGGSEPEDEPDATPSVISVRTIHPRHDPSLAVHVSAPAYVEAYYRVDLQARASGPVKFIQKDKGDPVNDGERLVELDVPDLVQDVEAKKAAVAQRMRELELSQAGVKLAEAGVITAQHEIKRREAEVDKAAADQVFHQSELARFQQMARDKAVTPIVVDERLKAYQAAKAEVDSTRVSVLKAQSDLEEARARLQAAKADVDLKKSLIDVAKRNQDLAQAFRDFAVIRAPFDGVIVAREVGPGWFVHNATTGHTKSLLTVERTDIVTIYMKVPDNYAPYVTRDTEAIIEMSELPNQVIHGKVTRFAPSLQTPEHDRTMRVEVDLYNRSRADYDRFLAKEKQLGHADLKGGTLPWFPAVANPNLAEAPRLLPGMYGTMQLVLKTFNQAYLVPSSAVVSQGGKSFIFEVVNDVAHQVPVEVQVDDGNLAKVVRIVKAGQRDVKQDLTGKEELVLSNQGELSDGQAVKPTPVEW